MQIENKLKQNHELWKEKKKKNSKSNLKRKANRIEKNEFAGCNWPNRSESQMYPKPEVR